MQPVYPPISVKFMAEEFIKLDYSKVQNYEYVDEVVGCTDLF